MNLPRICSPLFSSPHEINSEGTVSQCDVLLLYYDLYCKYCMWETNGVSPKRFSKFKSKLSKFSISATKYFSETDTGSRTPTSRMTKKRVTTTYKREFSPERSAQRPSAIRCFDANNNYREYRRALEHGHQRSPFVWDDWEYELGSSDEDIQQQQKPPGLSKKMLLTLGLLVYC